MDGEWGRPLPLELHAEMHKCLPLAEAINILVNISNRAIVYNNKSRMLRTIQRVKTSLNGYIDTLVNPERDNNREELIIHKNIEWKPELGALLRFGNWLTQTRKFLMPEYQNSISGMPKNFAEELLLHLANSSSKEMMLQYVDMNFWREPIPIPSFINQLFKEKQYRSDGRIVFESVKLKADDGRTFCIYDGELRKCYGYDYNDKFKLRLVVVNKMNPENWFRIWMTLDSTKKFIRQLGFKQWSLSKFGYDEVGWSDGDFKQNGNILEAKEDIGWNTSLDMFIRRGADFTKFRHIKIKENYHFYPTTGYINLLINYISNAKYPEEFLESIDVNFKGHPSSSFIDKIYQNCQHELPKGGKFIDVYGIKKLHILSAKTVKFETIQEESTDRKRYRLLFGGPKPKEKIIGEYKLEFALANGPSNGKYVFDFVVQFKSAFRRISEIKIQKRKMNDIIVEVKNTEHIEQGKKRKKAANDEENNEDGPSYSGKIMKK